MLSNSSGLYIVHISIHGLIRGTNLELGRDPDTGGQTKYVVELTEALGRDERVGRVDLLTRRVIDPRVSDDYAEPIEQLAANVFIRRITCGPKRYLRKESLWKHLDVFIDQALLHFRSANRMPDVIHAHYADAGYVGRELAQLMGCPFIFTGHSLGRIKRQRLLDRGLDLAAVEGTYSLSRRIEAEELSLDAAAMVVTSTRQEVREQYELYEQYAPDRMNVIPPGVDLDRFHPPAPNAPDPPIAREVDRFLRDPSKPIVLAISRADERKNIDSLVRAFGLDAELRSRANLVIVAGSRDDMGSMDKGTRRLLTGLLVLIDQLDLYGSIAYPKKHSSQDVPDLYRIAAARQGVFVNPALTEPFGLTLLEAAASGVPIVATRDGGPQDIIANCDNGVLVDPLDENAIAAAVRSIIFDPDRRERLARRGLAKVRERYTWESHVNAYLARCESLLQESHYRRNIIQQRRTRLPLVDRLIVSDLDNLLTGSEEALSRFLEYLEPRRDRIAFGITTGRGLDSAAAEIERWNIPFPDVLITSQGGEIYYGKNLVPDKHWERHLDYNWQPDMVRAVLDDRPGFFLQAGPDSQARFKVSYDIDPEVAPSKPKIYRILREHGLRTRVFVSHGVFLDVIPIRSSKALALRYIALRWGIAQDHILAAAAAGSDIDMIIGGTLGVIVRNPEQNVSSRRDHPNIFYPESPYADGLLEGIDHYRFDGRIILPEES